MDCRVRSGRCPGESRAETIGGKVLRHGRALAAAACIMLAGALPLRAQPFEFLGWGVQAGVNQGYVDFEGAIEGLDPGWGTGYTIWPFAEFSLAGGVSLRPGLRFDHFKNHSAVIMDGSRGWSEIVLDCICMPVLAKVSIGSGPRILFIAGPELVFVCKAESITGLWSGESTMDLGSYANRIDAMLDTGLGVAWDALGREFFVQGMYSRGISNPAKEGYWLSGWRTHEIAVTAGVMF
ncbi:MAG: outer membrane beta-barrel protein [Candidatus Krumholzibacteria bacterium]|nr:outer membrane beta-barrel protein [Candidatus Krumholzibacteria bacterium]